MPQFPGKAQLLNLLFLLVALMPVSVFAQDPVTPVVLADTLSQSSDSLRINAGDAFSQNPDSLAAAGQQ